MQQPPIPNQQYPQQQWQQPPMPPLPKKKSHKRLWLILDADDLVPAVSIGCALQSQSQKPAPATQATQPTHTTQQPTLQPTTAPTTKPTPTATTPSNPGSAILGAQPAAFTAKFGQRNDHSSSSMPHLARCNNSNIDQLIFLQISNQSATGPIAYIDFNFCPGANNTVSTAEAVCSTFFPLDAVYQKSVTIPGSSSQFAQFDKIYYSTTLAHEFTADNFTNASQNPVKPGHFDANYLYANNNDTSHIDSCTIRLGTQRHNES